MSDDLITVLAFLAFCAFAVAVIGFMSWLDVRK